MKLNHKSEMSAVEKIYQEILQVYPFLTKTEEIIFKNKSKGILDKFAEKDITTYETIKKLLALLNGNIHAGIQELQQWYRPNRNFIRKAKAKKFPTFKIKNRILFIRIPSWLMWLGKINKKLVSFCQKNIKNYDALVIDVQENNGGASSIAHDFANIFFKKTVVYGKFITKSKNGKLKTTIGKLDPNKKIFIGKPIVILISRKCFSSNELFLAPFKISKRAVLIGESTGGGSGNPVSEIIKIDGKKFVVRIPRHRFSLKGENKPIEKTKIKPDIIYRGNDIENFAKNYLSKQEKPLKCLNF